MIRYLIIIFLLATAAPGWGATYNIGPGETYETFAAFHAAVTPTGGDIIDGGGNTFAERIHRGSLSGLSELLPIVYQNFTLTGESGRTEILDIERCSYIMFSNVTISDTNSYLDNGNTDAFIYIDKSSNITLSSVTLSKGGSTDAMGILVNCQNGCDASNLTITNLTSNATDEHIRVNVFGTGTEVCGDEGTANDMAVTGANLTGGTHGLRFYGTETGLGANPSWRPDSLTFTNNTGTGIAGPLIASSAAGLTNVTITGNTATNLTGTITNAFQLGWVDGGTVSQNIVDTITTSSSDGSGIILDWSWTSDSHICNNLTVSRNKIDGCTSQSETAGIVIYKGTNNTVESNIILNSQYGIQVSEPESTGNTIYNNTIIDSVAAGISASDPGGDGAPAITVTNNIVSGGQYCLRTRNNSTWFTETYNLCYNPSVANASHNGGAQDLHETDLTSDPDLDAAYRPNPGSPVIGAGTTGLGVTTDYYGRSFFAAPSIGAAEYCPRFNNVSFFGADYR